MNTCIQIQRKTHNQQFDVYKAWRKKCLASECAQCFGETVSRSAGCKASVLIDETNMVTARYFGGIVSVEVNLCIGVC